MIEHRNKVAEALEEFLTPRAPWWAISVGAGVAFIVVYHLLPWAAAGFPVLR